MHLCARASVLALALSPSLALAERYGSETAITIQGVYYEAGAPTTSALSNGDTKDRVSVNKTRITNRTILEAMVDRNKIPSIAGYRLVLVGQAHLADGVSIFAAHKTNPPVLVPSDLLGLYVNDGPADGTTTIDADARLKNLKRTTYNLATLKLVHGFEGATVLAQTWSAQSVKKDGETEVVELCTTSGTFSGALDYDPEVGVGVVKLTLDAAKPVDLTPYGMATGESSSTYVYGSITTTLGGVLTIGGAGSLNFGSGIVGVTNSGFVFGNGTLTLETIDPVSVGPAASYSFANGTLLLNAPAN